MIVKPLYTPRYVPTGNEVAVFETSKGTIRVRLFGKDAPVTVGNFVELAQKGFYDHQNFHGRVEGAAPLPSDDDLPETIVVEGEDGPQEVPNPVYQAMQALAHLLERKVVV